MLMWQYLYICYIFGAASCDRLALLTSLSPVGLQHLPFGEDGQGHREDNHGDRKQHPAHKIRRYTIVRSITNKGTCV